jgi:hypothetical protein
MIQYRNLKWLGHPKLARLCQNHPSTMTLAGGTTELA